jgi:uridine kinase
MSAPETVAASGRSGREPLLVGIAGGSGSGKTTLARALEPLLGPERVALLSHDAYYRDRPELPAAERAQLNYDVPEAFDQALFLGHLRALRAGATVRPPRYCFSTHRRIGAGADVAARDVVIVDGILLLHDAQARAALDLKIYLDVPDRVRLARRIARDTLERGRTRRSVLSQYDATVRTAYRDFVEPSRKFADLVLMNVGRLDGLAEVAASLIVTRLERRQAQVA